MKLAVAALIPITAFLYFPMWLEEFEQPKAAALVTFACFAGFFVDWRKIRGDIAAQALAIIAASSALSALVSIDWRMSVFGNPKCPAGVSVWVSYLVFYIAARDLTAEGRRTAVGLMVVCSFFVACYAILQVLGIDFKTWHGFVQLNDFIRPMSSLGHPNFMACYLAMVLPFSIDGALSSRSWKLAAYAATGMVSVAAIFLSQSRGMWLAAMAALLVYALKMRSRRVLVGLGVAALSLGVTVAATPSARREAVDRLQHIVSPGPARIEYWKAATRIYMRYPFLGSGTDTYELAFQHQRTPYYWAIESRGSPHRAHNDFLNFLATQGIPGGVGFGLLVLATLWLSWRSRSAPAAAAASAYLVSGISSFTVVAVGVIFLICLVILRHENAASKTVIG